MIKLCLFDLDQTLVDTDDLAVIRECGKNRSDDAYIESVTAAWGKKADRLFYSLDLLRKLRSSSENMKLGIFTRSPRAYANAILQLAYPGFYWDVIVAYEDVAKTKPYGNGVHAAMKATNTRFINHVALVGDSDVDVRAAYNAGCIAILDKTSWAETRSPDNWHALEKMPDCIISSPAEIVPLIENYKSLLPDLERRLYGVADDTRPTRFDRINKFVPRSVGGDSRPTAVYACGRSFSNYDSLKNRRQWHSLSKSIKENKESDTFPEDWLQSVRSFVSRMYHPEFITSKILITVIPHRPGREPRLESFLEQIRLSYVTSPAGRRATVTTCPDLLAYRPGVRSNSKEFLNREERFENIEKNLFVKRADIAARSSKVLVIDDVCTSGSSLIYAKKYIERAGASEVTCLSIALNVSDVLYGRN